MIRMNENEFSTIVFIRLTELGRLVDLIQDETIENVHFLDRGTFDEHDLDDYADLVYNFTHAVPVDVDTGELIDYNKLLLVFRAKITEVDDKKEIYLIPNNQRIEDGKYLQIKIVGKEWKLVDYQYRGEKE